MQKDFEMQKNGFISRKFRDAEILPIDCRAGGDTAGQGSRRWKADQQPECSDEVGSIPICRPTGKSRRRMRRVERGKMTMTEMIGKGRKIVLPSINHCSDFLSIQNYIDIPASPPLPSPLSPYHQS
ncbi:hypothetical protein L2E82_12631 [Cichorium intybus]|uniref:Uncharacterized protein n=1 Tax=Cichorium intybus TaxID=13427 RepID=A0ACB9GGM3_CICIN|nr:hypothetical protein L2E82_12631 [Cichorium intybus]